MPIACILEQCGRIPCEGETQLSEQKRIFLGSFLKNIVQRKSVEIVMLENLPHIFDYLIFKEIF